MADNFFNKSEEQTVEPQAQDQSSEQLPEAIKVGEKAYTQEELQSLVGLGESAKELESKWNTKIDRLMPEYTRTTQELAEIKRQREEATSQAIQQKQQQGQQLSVEEIRNEAARQLKELMTHPEMQQTLRETYVQNRGAERLIEDSEYVLSDYVEQGFEAVKNVTIDDLLAHMANTGIKYPDKALKDMLEPEYDAWKQSQLATLKESRFVTQPGSTAGSKQPADVPVPKNRDQLAQQLRDFIANVG